MSAQLHIATIANDLAAYAALRRSMELAGFDEQRCRFTLFDNSASNQFEPHGVLRSLPTDGDEPYVILCHQDLEFGPEATADRLLQRVEQLNAQHPRWAVAGNAGTTPRGRYVLHLDEPTGSYRATTLPARVISLDENFLVLRRSRFPRVSPGLSGFHLYGTDLVLNAMLAGDQAYVIDVALRHLSAGNPASAAFNTARDQLMDHWRNNLLLGVVRTMCTGFCLSRWSWLDRLMNWQPRIGTVLRLLRWVYIPTPAAVRAARRDGHAVTQAVPRPPADLARPEMKTS